MSKLKNFFMATTAVVLIGERAPAATTVNQPSETTKVSVPVSGKKKNANFVRYPTNVAQLNEMAVEALEKKQYKTCIDLCERVLITGHHQQYAMACYTMGRAYMAQNNYKRAIPNFELAVKYYNTYGVSRPKKDVDYKKMFDDALTNAYKTVKDVTLTEPAKGSSVKKK
jgi:tetratricopeptide (TPR) repeat protein